MIRLIEAMNYRCLRHVRQPLGPFHVLVGPNASGKSSFLDVLMFLSKLVAEGGLEASGGDAISDRSNDIYDLFWQRTGERFELAVEASLEDDSAIADLTASRTCNAIRYEVALGLDEQRAARILDEQVHLTSNYIGPVAESDRKSDSTLFTEPSSGDWTPLIGKDGRMNLNGNSVVYRPTGRRTVFSSLTSDDFPEAELFERVISNRVALIELKSAELHRPLPPWLGEDFRGDGGNLPAVIKTLQERAPERYRQWISHVQQAIPDIESIRVINRPEDHWNYVAVRYLNGLEVPSWMVSQGTLRVIALTLIGYLPTKIAHIETYLVEEPETSIHPLNVELVMQSLSSAYDAQILVTTHSPTVLDATKAEDILVFSRTADGGTSIVKGSEHPALRQWKGEPNLSVMHASGVLG